MFGSLAVLGVFASHALLLTMPYFWDEVGTTVPAAQALARHFSWRAVAQVPAWWVAGTWALLGHSAVAVRATMLAVASAALMGVFLLAVELCGSLRGIPALLAAAAVAVSPLFYTQAVLAQSPVFALAGTVWALWSFLRGRHAAAAALAVIVVWQSPSGWTLPLVLFIWLMFESRPLSALWYLAPLASWLAGHPALETPHGTPLQMGVLAGQRLFGIFIADGHWLALAGLVRAASKGLLSRRRWGVAGVWALSFLLVSFFARPLLDRDMLPVLPLLITGGIAGFHTLRPGRKLLACSALLLALATGLFVNRLLLPSAVESNLAMADFQALQRRTATFVEDKAARKGIAAAWPLSEALTQPALGYVKQPMIVLRLPDYTEATIDELPRGAIDVLVRYSRESRPELPVFGNRYARWLALRIYAMHDSADAGEIEQNTGLKLKTTFHRGGQWVEIYQH